MIIKNSSKVFKQIILEVAVIVICGSLPVLLLLCINHFLQAGKIPSLPLPYLTYKIQVFKNLFFIVKIIHRIHLEHMAVFS